MGLRAFLVAIGVLLAVPVSAAPTFHGLGDLPDGYSAATLIWVSDSGMAGGVAYNAGSQSSSAIVYSTASGLRRFEDLPGGVGNALHVSGGSRDGSTLIGRLQTDQGIQGFRYSETAGTTILEPLGSGETRDDWAHDFASDANRIVGTSNASATLWNEQGHPHSLGGLNSSFTNSYGYDISSDGSRVVGKSWNEDFDFQALLWSEASGMVGLGLTDPRPRGHYSEAVGISSDGSTVIGITTEIGYYAPFVWNESSALRVLDAPDGFTWASSYDSYFDLDVSGDGSVIVGGGLYGSAAGPSAFIYTSSGGVRLLSNYLESLGLDLAGWTLTNASGISENGRYIVGSGVDPTGRTSGWIVAIPEPGTGNLIFWGLLGLRAFGASQSDRSTKRGREIVEHF